MKTHHVVTIGTAAGMSKSAAVSAHISMPSSQPLIMAEPSARTRILSFLSTGKMDGFNLERQSWKRPVSAKRLRWQMQFQGAVIKEQGVTSRDNYCQTIRLTE